MRIYEYNGRIPQDKSFRSSSKARRKAVKSGKVKIFSKLDIFKLNHTEKQNEQTRN